MSDQTEAAQAHRDLFLQLLKGDIEKKHRELAQLRAERDAAQQQSRELQRAYEFMATRAEKAEVLFDISELGIAVKRNSEELASAQTVIDAVIGFDADGKIPWSHVQAFLEAHLSRYPPKGVT